MFYRGTALCIILPLAYFFYLQLNLFLFPDAIHKGVAISQEKPINKEDKPAKENIAENKKAPPTSHQQENPSKKNSEEKPEKIKTVRFLFPNG